MWVEPSRKSPDLETKHLCEFSGANLRNYAFALEGRKKRSDNEEVGPEEIHLSQPF